MTDSTPTITPADVKHSEFLTDLGDDWVAVDAKGHIVSRATSEQDVRVAAPFAAAWFSGKDIATHSRRHGKHLDGEAPERNAGNDAVAATTAPSPNSYEKILSHVTEQHDPQKADEANKQAADQTLRKQQDELTADLKGDKDKADAMLGNTRPKDAFGKTHGNNGLDAGQAPPKGDRPRGGKAA